MGSTLFLLRGSFSPRSAACRLTGGALENQVGSLGLFRAARGLVDDLGGLGADVGADMDMVVERSVGDDTHLFAVSPHCRPSSYSERNT